MKQPPYIELHARSAFSFLRGGSLPEDIARRAAELELPAMALCDRDGFYGAPRFFAAARTAGVRPIIGSEVTMQDGSVLPLLVETRAGYRNLCRLLTRSQLRAPKGASAVRWDELSEFSPGLVALSGDEEGPLARALERGGMQEAAGVLQQLRNVFGQGALFVEVQRHLLRGQEREEKQRRALAAQFHLPLLATNSVLYSHEGRRAVLDVFTCLRHHTHLEQAGTLLSRNSERYLKEGREMCRLFHDLPEAVSNTLRLGERLEFSLADLGYEFPVYPVPEGETMNGFLRRQTFLGARQRYGELSVAVQRQLDHELNVIEKLGFAGYFLIVWDLVNYCRDSQIMVQGRGSAANSAVCYSLGITAVDPVGSKLLFERFLSEGRKGWPDIDLDLPSGDRREQAIQEVYHRYGKLGAAMTANVITYRGRSAAREIGKALHLPPDILDRFSRLFANGDFPHTLEVAGQMQQAGLPVEHPQAPLFVSLYQAIYGLPRHLGQHSGGMIICQGQLDAIVPLENASMPGRVVAQWDKEDCEDMGIIKVDLLGLGMMSVLQDAIELTEARGHPVDLARIPKDDPATFEMMQRADTVGVFQIESRAQMATLPRMKPVCFYDVVIEVAIIRPGPIQGDMVHPYLARRAGREPAEYFDDRLRPVLERTLGVPLFQEQLLKMAMVLADFSGDEAEELRRALSFHRSPERMEAVGKKLRAGMAANGVKSEVIEKVIQSITAFALYGFPESHAISFAILAYGSAYLKTHYAPEFYASLLNNQPMGFYSSATLVKDGRRHGVRFRPVSVFDSEWRCTIGADDSIRLGFCVVAGLRTAAVEELLKARGEQTFQSMSDFKSRTHLTKEELRTLAEIGALNGLAEHRRDALWQVEKAEWPGELFARETAPRTAASPDSSLAADHHGTSAGAGPLRRMDQSERVWADYCGMNLTTGPHPMGLVRAKLPGVWRADQLSQVRHGARIQIAGNVICRQRPGTAKGFVFVSLEDETGVANAIVTPALFEKLRLTITQEPYLLIEGIAQNTENVVLIKAQHIEPLRHDLMVGSASHDFR